MFGVWLIVFLAESHDPGVVRKLRHVALIWRWNHQIRTARRRDIHESLKHFETFEAFCKSLYIMSSLAAHCTTVLDEPLDHIQHL